MEANPCASVTKPKASTEVVRWLSDDERNGAARRVQGVRLARPVPVRPVRAHDRRAQGRDRGPGMGPG